MSTQNQEIQVFNTLKTKINNIYYYNTRELSKLLKFSEYSKFKPLIIKTKETLKILGFDPKTHVAFKSDPLIGGNGAVQNLDTYYLTAIALNILNQFLDLNPKKGSIGVKELRKNYKTYIAMKSFDLQNIKFENENQIGFEYACRRFQVETFKDGYRNYITQHFFNGNHKKCVDWMYLIFFFRNKKEVCEYYGVLEDTNIFEYLQPKIALHFESYFKRIYEIIKETKRIENSFELQTFCKDYRRINRFNPLEHNLRNVPVEKMVKKIDKEKIKVKEKYSLIEA